MEDQNAVIVVQRHYKKDLKVVWKSITDHGEMLKWYFNNIPAFRPVKGFRTCFPVQSGHRTFTHQWEILEVDPPKLIRYQWTYEEYPGVGEVLFELQGKDGLSLLKVSSKGFQSFPQEIPEFKPESCRAGWEFFLGERLQDYLDRIN